MVTDPVMSEWNFEGIPSDKHSARLNTAYSFSPASSVNESSFQPDSPAGSESRSAVGHVFQTACPK